MASPCANCGWQPEGAAKWPTYGAIACRWIEENCICAEGDFYGQLIKLRRDQKRFVYRWYEYCPQCDYWHYGEAIRTAATGDGKTTFVAALVALEFGGPAVVAPASPNIIISAASFEQADLLFSITGTMLGGRDQMAKESPLCGFFEVYDTEISFSDGRPGTIRRIAAAAGTNEGGQPTFFACDEMHEWGDEGSNKARVYTVVGKSTKKRNVLYRIPDDSGDEQDYREVFRGPGRILKLSTAGSDIDHSLFGKMVVQARKAEKDPSIAPRLLFDIFEAPDGLDFEDPADRRIAAIAASPAAGILWNVEDRVAMYNTPGTSKNEWQRYYGNQWVDQATESWLKDHPGAWSQCQGEWEIQGDEPTVLAIDMALKRDSVAVVQVASLADGRSAVTARIWYPDNGKLPHTEIWEYIAVLAAELQDRFEGVVYDPRYFELHAQALEDDKGLLVIQFDQTPVRMAPAVGLTYDKIVAGTIVHNGDDDLRRMVHAAVKREQDRGFTLSKGRSRHHIDGAVAMCMGVWALAELAGDREPSVTQQIW
jgi:phage terminase large subunit-like protein